MDHEVDINCIVAAYERNRLFTFQPGRPQAFVAKDTFSAGYSKLKDSALSKFLEGTALDPESMEAYLDDSTGTDDSAPLAPLFFEDGELVEGEMPDLSTFV